MEKKHKILELRETLDKTLSLPDLANEECIKSLVKNQLVLSSLSSYKGDMEKIVDKRTKEVSNFLEMLRSASGNERKATNHEASHIDWKIKQDTDEFRVMYREGPQGTPFHTLLAEGYIDGPLDLCLCVSWEATLYTKWFPQYKVPTFKVLLSTCLEKVQVGEDISLVRVKVPWPISDREALLHYFEIEFLREDLILVLITSISDEDQVDESIDGFSRSIIPEAKDATRVDLIGGFALQKVDHNRSYFRSTATMDIKLDFVPPWLINFISRQLIGNGYKLFQKALSTVAVQDEDYLKALEGPMYARIRQGLTMRKKIKLTEDDYNNEKPTILPKEHIGDTATEIMSVQDDAGFDEIVEEEREMHSDVKSELDEQTINLTTSLQGFIKRELNISPEVEHALHILDNAITVLQTQKTSEHQKNYASPASKPVLPTNQMVNTDPSCSNNSNDKLLNHPLAIQLDKLSRLTVTSSASLPKVQIANLDQASVTLASSSQGELRRNSDTAPRLSFLETMNKVCDEGSLKANDFHKSTPYNHKTGWKTWFCCFTPSLMTG